MCTRRGLSQTSYHDTAATGYGIVHFTPLFDDGGDGRCHGASDVRWRILLSLMMNLSQGGRIELKERDIQHHFATWLCRCDCKWIDLECSLQTDTRGLHHTMQPIIRNQLFCTLRSHLSQSNHNHNQYQK